MIVDEIIDVSEVEMISFILRYCQGGIQE